MTPFSKKIAVAGAGYWGKNLVRNFHALGVLHTICDTDSQNLEKLKQQYSVPQTTLHYQDVLNDPQVDAVAIASPAVTHYALVKQALEAGKDVFVEKPIALELVEAQELIHLAETKKRILMVDHLLQYHPAVVKLKELIDAGKIGKLEYIYSNRLNIGKLRSEENILWSFAPHDISVILSLVEKFPRSVKAFGEAYLQEHIYDTTVTYLSFFDRLKAHIYVSWLHPYKEQKLVVIGSHGMLVFNDVEEEKLCLYPHKIEWIKQVPVAAKAEREVISYEAKEPLREACLHFLDCIEHRKKPKTDGHEALAVLQVLQQAQNSLEKEEQP
ncbi:MAG: Gfo/Idh/MocA family oxidoreductase [Candidatus Omnitrophica bacterium]|nr:Gfo/Idh/MocA family oxidoreductase [Candidatus Omnitrophota bacterium]